jgi:hypothetical protein
MEISLSATFHPAGFLPVIGGGLLGGDWHFQVVLGVVVVVVVVAAVLVVAAAVELVVVVVIIIVVVVNIKSASFTLDYFREGQEISLFKNVWTGCGFYPVVLGALFTGLSGRRTKLTTRLRQVPRLRMSGTIPLLLPCAFMACTETILPFYISWCKLRITAESQLHIRYRQNGYVVVSDNEHDSEKSVPVCSNREFFSLVTALSSELSDLMQLSPSWTAASRVPNKEIWHVLRNPPVRYGTQSAC